ncbi:hypothetical protein A2U01_0119476, partial [Trifolium medium]|nr:hypothetical protein [Trifolium medium]
AVAAVMPPQAPVFTPRAEFPDLQPS